MHRRRIYHCEMDDLAMKEPMPVVLDAYVRLARIGVVAVASAAALQYSCCKATMAQRAVHFLDRRSSRNNLIGTKRGLLL